MVKNEAKLVASHILLRCGSVPVERILLSINQSINLFAHNQPAQNDNKT